jgi:hypothetical protein
MTAALQKMSAGTATDSYVYGELDGAGMSPLEAQGLIVC